MPAPGSGAYGDAEGRITAVLDLPGALKSIVIIDCRIRAHQDDCCISIEFHSGARCRTRTKRRITPTSPIAARARAAMAMPSALDPLDDTGVATDADGFVSVSTGAGVSGFGF